MIKIKSASKERIETIVKSKKTDKILVEKTVRDLMLLEGLAKSDLLESSHYQISHFSRCTHGNFNRSFIDEGESDIFQRYILFCKDAGCRMLGLRFRI